MKTQNQIRLFHVWFVTILLTVFFAACQKSIDEPLLADEMYPSASRLQGHLKQTKTYSSEVVTKWMNMQLRVMSTTPGMPPTTNSRFFAYSGVALYESVQPGMPAYQSLSGQLQEMPVMPQTIPGYKYHWAASANAALALITKAFFPTTSMENKASIEALEKELNDQYKTEADIESLTRSVAFGKTVAQLVFDWSKSDRANLANAPYTPPVGPGLWAPTFPNYAPAATPYWGRNRLFNGGSLLNSDPPLPPPYSTEPSSPYYKGMEEVYNISYTLTDAQKAIGFYYRDVPGYVSGGHYLSILYQLLVLEQPSLDFSAVAFAKSGIGVADALIGSYNLKYRDVNGGPVTNTERPVTFIRNVMGKEWNTLFGFTPPFPDFPSAHATASGAIEVIFSHLFGENYAFTNHAYDYLGMPPQSYTSFSDMAQQIGFSRLYAGIHNRYACEAGRAQGQKIGQNILSDIQFLKE